MNICIKKCKYNLLKVNERFNNYIINKKEDYIILMSNDTFDVEYSIFLPPDPIEGETYRIIFTGPVNSFIYIKGNGNLIVYPDSYPIGTEEIFYSGSFSSGRFNELVFYNGAWQLISQQ
jgi:hypothetical protein